MNGSFAHICSKAPKRECVSEKRIEVAGTGAAVKSHATLTQAAGLSESLTNAQARRAALKIK